MIKSTHCNQLSFGLRSHCFIRQVINRRVTRRAGRCSTLGLPGSLSRQRQSIPDNARRLQSHLVDRGARMPRRSALQLSVQLRLPGGALAPPSPPLTHQQVYRAHECRRIVL